MFCCGIAGHIARNCPNPPAVPVYAHHLKNLSNGDSAKSKPLRSCSNDSDWSANKTKTKILTTREQIYVRKYEPREGCAKPNLVKQKPSRRLSINHHSKQKPTNKGKTNVSSSVVQPTRLDLRPKPIYRWVLKVPTTPSSDSSVQTLNSKQDMSWKSVRCVDRNGKPSHKMVWAPKSI